MKSWFLQAEDSVTFLKGDVELIGVHTYLIANNRIIIAENVVEIEKDGSTYIAFEGSGIKTFTKIPPVNAKLEATSELQTDELPIRNLDIKLEGESHASVWVTDHLSGKGESKSSLSYDGSPVIDYITQGEATIQND